MPVVLKRMAAKAVQNGRTLEKDEQTAVASQEPKEPEQQSEKASGCTCIVM